MGANRQLAREFAITQNFDPITGAIGEPGSVQREFIDARAVLEAVGIRDILTKSLGSSNVLNSVQATLQALSSLKSPQEEATRRGKSVEELVPYWERRKKNG